MKVRVSFVAAAVFFAALSGAGWAIEDPIGLVTVPPSSIRSGLVRSPNPIDTRANLVITGNVGGGKHFRGIVPYGATSDFEAVLGSSLFDSFLRRWAGPASPGRYTGTYEPYYSPFKTVTTTRPGQAEVIRPPTAKIGDRAADRVGLPTLSTRQSLLLQGLLFPGEGESYGILGVTATSLEGMEETVLAEVPSLPVGARGRRLTDVALQQIRTKRIQDELLEGEVPTKRVRNGLLSTEDRETESEAERLRQELKQAPSEIERELELLELRRAFVTERKEERAVEARLSEEPAESLQFESGEAARVNRAELWDSILREDSKIKTPFELQEATKESEKVLAERFRGDEFGAAEAGGGEIALRKQGKLAEFPDAEKGVLEVGIYERMKQEVNNFGLPQGGVLREGLYESYLAGGESTGKIRGMSYEQQAKAILGPHRTLASFSEAKFNQHLRDAESYLKQGMYYQAVDAYTVALVYKPENPFACVGKSHALFAAGEYMSSALFLSRALGVFPEYEKKLKAKKKEPRTGDNFALLGSGLSLIDRDKLENRIVEIEQWQQKTDSAELQFLLGYIYYQMGRGERAKEAVEKAYEKAPGIPGIIILKEAIDSAQP